MKILVAYGTKKGSTGEVAEVVAETLREQGFDTDLLPASQVKDLGSYAAVVLGGSIYMGKLHPDVQALLKSHRGELREARPRPGWPCAGTRRRGRLGR